MTQPFEHWTVLPHDELIEVDTGVLTVSGKLDMPLVKIPRRMTVARLEDRRLVIFNAIALHDEEMRVLESYGTPTYLVVPSDHHRLDVKIWKDRYPSVAVLAPPGAKHAVQQVVRVDATEMAFDDPNVVFIVVPGTQGHEAALLIKTPHGHTLVLNDLVANIRDPAGFGGWLLRVAGFAGAEAQIPVTTKLTLIKDAAALRQQLLEWSELESLNRILVSHGDIIDNKPRQVLRDLAASLEGS